MKRPLATSILCLTLGFVVAGCGGSDEPAASTDTPTQSQPDGARGGPGGSGKVVEVSGSTAQVQGQGAQVAVTWTGDTSFTQQIDGSGSDVKVGSCVLVSSDAEDNAGEKVAAASVRITEAADDGSCSIGGPGGGVPGGGRPTDLPSDRPTDRPTSRPGGGQRGGFAVGEVTAVTGGGFTVKSVQPGGDGDSPTSVEVATSGDTTYSKTAGAEAPDVKVGVCVTSIGDADDTGAITATTIAITQPVDGECGFGGFGGRRPS